jgi:hypothetical protein
MEIIIKVFTVFISAAAELISGIPLGIALGLNPMVIGLATAIGGLVSAGFVILVGRKVRMWVIAHMGEKENKGRGKFIHRIWERYGVIGLGLLAPLVTGVPLGAALGVTMGAPPGRLFFWLSIGVLIWTVGLSLAGMIGMAGFKAIHR